VPLADHGLPGCRARCLPGSPQWKRVVKALPDLLRQGAARGDPVATKLLAELGALLGGARR
jgi:hypothetical protein